MIDVRKLSNQGKVVFGSTVKAVNLQTDIEVTYQIVGEDEADLKNQTISITSPLARAIIGKNEGDELEVQTPQGIATYEIVKVEYL